MPRENNCAVLHIPFRDLDGVLDLPEGLHVRDLYLEPSSRSCAFVVTGACLPVTDEGRRYPELRAVYGKDPVTGRVFWKGYDTVEARPW
jgi:hypothetical protein